MAFLVLLDPSIVAEIIPDYRMTVCQVFKSFTKAVIRSISSLDLLRRAGVTTVHIFSAVDGHFLLSWAEDLTCASESLDRNTIGMTHLGMYCVGGGIPSEVQFLDEDTILSCGGIILDSIDGTNISFAISERDPGFRPPVKLRSSQNAYTSEEAVLDAVWRSLVGNRTESQNSGSIPLDN